MASAAARAPLVGGPLVILLEEVDDAPAEACSCAAGVVCRPALPRVVGVGGGCAAAETAGGIAEKYIVAVSRAARVAERGANLELHGDAKAIRKPAERRRRREEKVCWKAALNTTR
jgi:hypothetical protein